MSLANCDKDNKFRDKEVHDLSKIPDRVFMKALRNKVDEQAEYIRKLEKELNILKANDKEGMEEKKKMRKEEIFKEYRERIVNLEKIIQRLRKNNEELILEKLHSNKKK